MTDSLTGKNIVILGLARQGTALARWLCGIGARVTLSDARTRDQLAEPMAELKDLPITYVLGRHPELMLEDCDLLCLSGGVPLDLPIVQAAVERRISLSNDAQLFLERAPCSVIGITGSAGKTTTTALVGKMIDASGALAWVGGNIGNPLISDLAYMKPADTAVMELSSFQLEIMTSSPHIAAVTNITPNHLDRHKTMEAYIDAKANILTHQIIGDLAVLNYDDPNSAALAERAPYEVAFFSARVPQDVGAWLVPGTGGLERVVCRPRFEASMESVVNVAEIPLRGAHNVMNVLAACAIAGVAGLPFEAMRAGILGFKPVDHRLEVVREVEGVTYVNDSIATAPERVIAALEAYRGTPLVLLLGGRDKNLPWDDLCTLAAGRCRAVITFGEAGKMIAEGVSRARLAAGSEVQIEQVGALREAVDLASQIALEGDVVLLSPGGTSYDAYVDFEARGEEFRRLVGEL
jgi:UDP-N-acetylmuramoylalanine--D-glutamate ligase